jgi:drug/metabolite transporter (DMT)-like permease
MSPLASTLPLRPGVDRAALAPLALSFSALCWAGNFVAGRALRHDIDPATLTLLRWSLTLLLLLCWVGPRAWRCRRVIVREWRLLFGLGATGIAAFHTLAYLSLAHTSAIHSMLMLSLTPAAILVAAPLTGAAWPSHRQWAGAGLSMLGAAVLVTRGDASLLLALHAGPGELWMLLAVACWAAYSLLLRRRPADLPNDVTLAASCVPAIGLLLALVAFTAPHAAIEPTPRLVGLLAYIVVFASLIPFLLWSWAVGVIGPERAGPYVHLLPLFGTGLAVLLLGESIAAPQLAGGALVLAGLVLAHRTSS